MQMAGCPNTICAKFVYSIQISQILNNKFDKGYRNSYIYVDVTSFFREVIQIDTHGS